MYAVAILLYVFVVGAAAWLLGRFLTRGSRPPWVRWAATGLLAPVVFFLPLADEVVGSFQFRRVCEDAKEMKIYGTILVGEDLYTPDGRWRIGLSEGEWAERMAAGRSAKEALAKYVRRSAAEASREVPAVIPIRRHEYKVFDARTDQLLAEWRHYSTDGGWMSRLLSIPGDKLLVRQQCMPEEVWQGKHYQRILRLSRSPEIKR